MNQVEQPIKIRRAVQEAAKGKSPGMLVLYEDRLVHVESRIPNWCAVLGFLLLALISYALTKTGPGALGGAIGAGGGMAIGTAIAKRQVPKKVAAGGQDITVVPLDSITSVAGHKAPWPRGWQLLVSASPGTQYTFRARPDQWSPDLASALAGRGRKVQADASGLTIASGSGPQHVAS